MLRLMLERLVCTSSTTSDSFMMASPGSDWRKGMLQRHRRRKEEKDTRMQSSSSGSETGQPNIYLDSSSVARERLSRAACTRMLWYSLRSMVHSLLSVCAADEITGKVKVRERPCSFTRVAMDADVRCGICPKKQAEGTSHRE